jgi:hypothetical protein
MPGRLRDELVGGWTLVSYREHPVDGSEPSGPPGLDEVTLHLGMVTPMRPASTVVDSVLTRRPAEPN